MIGDALDTVFTLAWALILWVIAAGIIAALIVASLTALVARAWDAVRSGPRRPSWARGRLRARIHARRHTRAPHRHTAPRAPRETT